MKSLRFVSAILLLLTVLLLIPTSDSNRGKDHTIYIYAPKNGIFSHSEIILKADDLNQSDKRVKSLLHRGRGGYLAFSFGDKAFMMDKGGFEDINYPLALKALFLPTPSLMKVAHMRDFDKSMTFKVDLNEEGFKRLERSVLESFKTKEGLPVPYFDKRADRFYDYYEAKRAYNLLYTCNSWTADMLRRAGIGVSRLVIFGWQLRLKKRIKSEYI
jgi:hypothetical protein